MFLHSFVFCFTTNTDNSTTNTRVFLFVRFIDFVLVVLVMFSLLLVNLFPVLLSILSICSSRCLLIDTVGRLLVVAFSFSQFFYRSARVAFNQLNATIINTKLIKYVKGGDEILAPFQIASVFFPVTCHSLTESFAGASYVARVVSPVDYSIHCPVVISIILHYSHIWMLL